MVRESGVVEFRYQSVGERAQALLAIAAADFRDQVGRAWRPLHAAHIGA